MKKVGLLITFILLSLVIIPKANAFYCGLCNGGCSVAWPKFCDWSSWKCPSYCQSGNNCYYTPASPACQEKYCLPGESVCICAYQNSNTKPSCNNYCGTLSGYLAWFYNGYALCGVIGWACIYNHTFCLESGVCCTPACNAATGCYGISKTETQNCGSGDCVGTKTRTCKASCDEWGSWSDCSSEGKSCCYWRKGGNCDSSGGCTQNLTCVKGVCNAECNQDGTGCPSGKTCDTATCTCYTPYTPPPPCTGTLSLSISGSETCTVTASLTASNCSGQSWQIKDNGNTKCSGTVSGSSYSYTCSSWTVSSGVSGTTYTYKLYIGGSQKDSESVTCNPAPCSDSCSGYQLVDHNSDCVKNTSCGTASTRYTGGECTVCPLNNNYCSLKYSGNTQTSQDCFIPENMWSNEDFTISHKVTFLSSATLTVKGDLILNSGGELTAPSGVTVVFYVGKEIKLQGGKILMKGGYIIKK